MPLETASYIHELEPSNPAGTDQLAQGDDHLRLLKSVLQATFPNLTGPVTKTQAELNVTNFVLPAGIVSMWYGTSGTVPAGYAICNGQTVARADGTGDITTPDMTNLLPIGVGSIAAQGVTAGASSVTPTTGTAGTHAHTIGGGSHSHTATILGTSLTEAQLPSHKHANGVTDNGSLVFSRGTIAAATVTTNSIDNSGALGTTEGWTSSTGGGEAHTHGFSLDASSHSHTLSDEGSHAHSVTVATIPPVRGMWFIMKT